MAKVNKNFENLVPSYLFAEISKRVNEFTKENPDKPLIRLGIGDVTRPLAPIVVEAMKKGCDELSKKETFKGYPDYEGYEFARQAVSDYYKTFGVDVDKDEILINDGAKSDAGNITDIFDKDNVVLVTDPVYPVYVDTNIMGGRKIIYADANENNGFNASPDPSVHADLIYLCSPNNPTGAAMNKEQLKAWVDYAINNNAVIFYDAAYEAYITEEDVPHTIFECEGARTCAIELRSFSKNAGFTGTRLGFTVIPKDLKCGDVSLHSLWARRHGTKYNGAPYIIQKAGLAYYTEEGKAQLKEQVAYYMNNARVIKEGLSNAGFTVFGGVNAPYIWLKTPDKMTSWEFFDYLLEKGNIVGTPGSGFGPSGEGYFRLTAFGSHENTLRAMERIKNL